MRKFALLLISFFSLTSAKGQISYSDSAFLDAIFINQVYINTSTNSGVFYLYDSISSKAKLTNSLDSIFKFSESEVTNSYDKIKLLSNPIPITSINNWMNYYYGLNPNYGMKQTNPFFKIDFILNNKNASTYTAITPSVISNPKVAYLIIPGSGDNTMTDFLTGNGYHNIYCNVKNTLKPTGDVYTYTRPLQDYRALKWEQNRLMCDFPSPSFSLSYLRDKDKLYGGNCLIEIEALVKYLKTKYQYVNILALSHGGLYTLLSLREFNVEGVMISGGYTSAINTPYFDPLTQGIAANSQFFGNLTYNLVGDSVKSIIEKNNGDYYFTWETGVPIENTNHFTQNFLGPQVNVKYFYGYGPSHSFPPCSAITSFFDSVNSKAKPVIRELSKTCVPVQANILIKLSGKKPYSFSLFRNDTLLNNYTLNQDSMLLSLTQAGKYQIKNVLDSLGKPGFKSDIYNFVPNANIEMNLVSSEFICDSNKFKYTFSLSGTPYWKIEYTKNGANNLIQNYFNDSISFFWNSGIYKLTSIEDNGGCVRNLSDSINIPSILSFGNIFKSLTYNCEKDSTKLSLQPEFLAVNKIIGLKNGLIDTLYPNGGECYLSNGNYQINKIQFNNGCIKIINIGFTVQETPLSLVTTNDIFNCDSLYHDVGISLTGKSPWKIYYSTDSNVYEFETSSGNDVLHLKNGFTTISTVVDGNFCITNPLIYKQENDTAASMTFLNKFYNCDSNKTQLEVSLTGKSPWTLYFFKNGNFDSLTFTNSHFNLLWANGDYLLDYIEDANHCQYILNELVELNETPIFAQLTSKQFNCNTQQTDFEFSANGKSPFMLQYFANGLAQTAISNSSTISLSLPNDNYFFSSLSDSNNCVYSLNEQHNIQFNSIQIIPDLPIYNCTSHLEEQHIHFEGNAPFTLHYTKNSLIDSLIINGTDTIINWSNGDYLLNHVVDYTGCEYPLNQTYAFNNDSLEITIGTPIYLCDSNKSKVHFELSGNAPFIIDYIENSTSKQLVSNLNSFDHYFSDGIYYFSQITDSNGCSNTINQLYSFSFQPMSANIINQAYNCDSDKYEIKFAFTGNSPWQIVYTDGLNTYNETSFNNTYSIFLNNGNWSIIKVYNNTGCEQYLNTNFNIAYNQIGAQVIDQNYDCDSNKLRVQFSISGNPPWTINYVKNNPIPDYLSAITFDPNFNLYLDSGSYVIMNIVDATGCGIAPLYQSVFNSFTPLSIQLVDQFFNCDSLKQQFNFSIHGDGPWMIFLQHDDNMSIDTILSNNANVSFLLIPGDYHIIGIHDTKCSLATSIPMQVNYSPLTTQILDPVLFCDSNKFKIMLVGAGGTKPYTYEYLENGILKSIQSNSDTLILFLSNGNYLFMKMTDSSGCSYLFTKYFNLQYDSFQLNGLTTFYHCGTDSTEIIFDINPLPNSLWMYYQKSGGSLDSVLFNSNNSILLENGLYNIISIKDSMQCSQQYNINVNIENEPLNFEVIEKTKNCESKLFDVSISLTGKSPWKLFYNLDNITDTLIINSNSFNWQTPSGNYYFINVSDSNACELNLNQTILLNPFISDNLSISQSGNTLVASEVGAASYIWYLNNSVFDTTSQNKLNIQQNGIYRVEVIDEAGCKSISNDIEINFDSPITIFPNPTSGISEIFIYEKFGDYWSLELVDMGGKTVLYDKEINSNTKKIDFSHLESGVYNIIITYESDFTKHILRLTKY